MVSEPKSNGEAHKSNTKELTHMNHETVHILPTRETTHTHARTVAYGYTHRATTHERRRNLPQKPSKVQVAFGHPRDEQREASCASMGSNGSKGRMCGKHTESDSLTHDRGRMSLSNRNIHAWMTKMLAHKGDPKELASAGRTENRTQVCNFSYGLEVFQVKFGKILHPSLATALYHRALRTVPHRKKNKACEFKQVGSC